jgi:hypothetical protein
LLYHTWNWYSDLSLEHLTSLHPVGLYFAIYSGILVASILCTWHIPVYTLQLILTILTSYIVASFCLCFVSCYTSKTSFYLLEVYFISLLRYLIFIFMQ